MRANQLLTIAVVSSLLIGGMAALGAASPAAEATDNADVYDDSVSNVNAAANNTDTHDDAASKSNAPTEDRPGSADGVGPSDGLPEQVPDHVSEIHNRIDSFINRSVDNLGKSLSGLLGDGEAANGEAADDGIDNADGNAAA